MAVDCYKATEMFPATETFGLSSQIRRAVVSVAANIAEGHGRETSGSFIQFLRIAQGSVKETETHILLSARLGFIELVKAEALLHKATEIGKMLRGLIRRVQEKQEK